MDTEITVTREGRGPELLLVHGGASPHTTWQALRPLAVSWTLVTAHRRGYPPSPPGRHDFDVDAADLAPLLASRPHVLAHSYGTLGALIAAAGNPQAIRSLTLIEPPLFYLAADDPDVERLESMGNAVLTHGLDAEPTTLREFLRLAGAPDVPEGPLPPHLVHSVRRAHRGRLPGEARPALEKLRSANVPTLVVSGGHSGALERICDALAKELQAKRLVLPAAGHFVQAAPGFAEHLSRHLGSAP
jgi:pimeloyl-ACP methyl ester carboxylesterase